VALLLVLAGVSGCGGDSGAGLTVDGQRVPEQRLTAAVEGLCEARSDVGDLTAARAAFYDRSHEMLHVIAAALEPVDRAHAARLLRAKQAVEAGLAAPAAPAELGNELDRLTEVTRAGLDRLGVGSSACSQ
jgi:hypothetical protein